MNRSPLYAGLSVFALLHSGSLLPLVAGQAQEGNAGDTTDTAEANQSLQNGYFSYVSDMDSAESVRQAMETLSWASKGSSWMEGSTPEATEEQEQVSRIA